jgi:hypothetical protein
MNGAMRSASVAMTSGVTAAYNWTQFPASKGIPFYTPHLRALLRVLQEHEFERVGGTESIRESKIRSLRIDKKRFTITNPSADLISILSSANRRGEFRDFANVAKTRNLDVHKAT